MSLSISDTNTKYVDLSAEELVEMALNRQEGILSNNNSLVVKTGTRTGRSPKDRFIVKDQETESKVNWNTINQAFDSAQFDKLWSRACDYINDREHFVSHLCVGADPKFSYPVKVITELAWHNLFAKNLFINPSELTETPNGTSWTIISVPGMLLNPAQDQTNSEAAVILNMAKKRILICGTLYAGEMKKAMFSVLNYLLPDLDVLPMHCAANKGENNDVALFFGLSGTGKTTLSADPDRYLIGDDEHGWSKQGVFNFEGGCYAKCIGLSKENEPLIWNAIKSGTIMENVVLDNNKDPLYNDDSITQNTRAAYPRDYIEERVLENRAGNPSSVIFLTCDLYGVLPPVALLSKQQAAYYFLSGYTALVGSTEVGSKQGITSTFSTCFGAPFFPRPPQVYADLLMNRIEQTGCQVYLVNTGWTGGGYGKGGKRFSIPTTRAIVHAVLSGELKKVKTETMHGFNFEIPTAIHDIDSSILNPERNWQDKQAYQNESRELMQKFVENFKKFDVSAEIIKAGPHIDGK